MTVTALDPTTALVLIDLQFGIVAIPTAHNAAEIVNKGVELATTFRDHGLPVILATYAMSDTNLAAHENSIANVFPHLGETGTSQEILSLLAARAS
jgi:nicotinamidase-related amidase